MTFNADIYNATRGGQAGFHEQKRGLIKVWGKEAVQFLDGLITNDMKTLEDGASMLAAFPNAQGRLLAVVNVQRQGDAFLFSTEEMTREKVFQNLFRFTFAGDFFVEDLSEGYSYFEIFGPRDHVYRPDTPERWKGSFVYALPYGAGYFVPGADCVRFREFLIGENGVMEIDDALYETLRIENGIPKYGVDMDETTIVPELGLDGLISYNKGCYIGQEIIARIYFRGHVAKRLTGVVSDEMLETGTELFQSGKNAGRATSSTFSPKLGKHVSLAYVRYDYLEAGTKLISNDQEVTVAALPFI